MKLYQAPRGTTDILPEEQACWHYIKEKAAHICQLYGYERIDSPAFEDTSLFARSVGAGTDIVEKEMYSFTDKGGNQLTLRPEGTAPVCRAYLEHGFHSRPQPVKLYYLASIFRYERPQAGRYRQHYQFGCEAIGDDDPSLDAETIDLAWQFFRSLGLQQLALQLNSIGCKQCRPSYLKVLQEYYSGRAATLCNDCRARLNRNLLRLLDCKQPSCQDAAEQAPRSVEHLCTSCREHFEKLTAYLNLLQVPFSLNHRLVRGLDYYTRTVFEIQPENGGAQSTICGGGRYDDLIEELGGQPTPAIGFAIGMERIILNLKAQSVPVTPLPGPLVFIAHLGEKAKDEAFRLTSRLRQAGTGVTMATGTRSLKAQLRQANNLKAHFAVIIGEEELKSGAVSLRNMATAEQKTVKLKELPEILKN
jgi:histidyl-tRNA synthetase